MTEIHILTAGLRTANSRALLHPLLRYDSALASRGIEFDIYRERGPGLTDCNILALESKFYKDAWTPDPEAVLDDLSRLGEKVDTLVWFDTTDSTGTLQTEVLPYVDGYYKGQLHTDREVYQQPLYGKRPFTDFYHETAGIEDDSPTYLTPVENTSDLEKLGVSWNFGLTHYTRHSQRLRALFRRLPRRAFGLFPWEWYLGRIGWTNPSRTRTNDVCGRFSTGYDRNTVQYQRQAVADAIADICDTERVSPRAYWKELANSRLVVSPFGWGELCYRDFEAFRAGCVLVKPSMDHVDTWPPLYDAGETMVPVEWSLDDLTETVMDCLENYEMQSVAENGQRRYRQYLVDDSAKQAFVDRVEAILDDALS